MGVRANFSEIAFDIILPVADSQSLLERVARSAVNWAYTNWKGMTFGLLFAAAILNFLSFLSMRQFRNKWLNTVLGVITGAPLGVCVNCATPIAQGMYAAGARIETSLAALISSPTLNIIVLSMAFTLLPLNLALGKLFFVLIFIFLIPFLVKLSKLETLNADTDSVYLTTQNIVASHSKWGTSIKNVALNFFNNLLYIVKIALPLMLLAGLAGALAIELFPFSKLSQVEDSFINMFWLALVGVFLPVPIAFDVLTAVALMSAGANAALVAVLLFSLGSFSVYPFLMIARNISVRLSLYIFSVVVILSLAFGLSVKHLSDNDSDMFYQVLDRKIEKTVSRNKEIKKESSQIVQRVCQSLPYELQSKCMVNYLLDPDHHQQIEIQCEYLPEGFNLQQCKDVVRLAKLKSDAIKKKNERLCESLGNDYFKNDCMFSVVSILAVKNYDINVCSKLNNQAMVLACRNRYLHQEIEFQSDGAACEGVSDSSEKDICNKNFKIISYVEQENINACYGFESEGFKNHCLYSVAARIVGRSGDVSVCKKLLPNQNLFNQCEMQLYFRRAKKQQNTRECYSLKIAGARNKCVLNVAKLRINKGIESLSLAYLDGSSMGSKSLQNKSKVISKYNPINAPDIGFEILSEDDFLDISRAEYINKSFVGKTKFKKMHGDEMGVTRSWNVTALDFFDPFFMGKGIASGDFNNDHWPDLIVATESGVALYKNIGGKFVLNVFNNDLKNKNIFIVALVDVDNNGFQDIFASAYGGKNFVIFNYGNNFIDSKVTELHGAQKLTAAVGFADIDRDGYLDAVLGNWSNGSEKYFNPEVSRNEVAYYKDGGFVRKLLDAPKGETLSVLLSDVNNDSYIDILIANDSLMPDMYYFSNSEGDLELLDNMNTLVPGTPRNTMSIESADYNNDLKLDVFSVDMSFASSASVSYCESIDKTELKNKCLDLVQVYESMKGRNIAHCETIKNRLNKNNCYSAFALMAARTNHDNKFCEHLKNNYSSYHDLCLYLSKPAPHKQRIDYSKYLPQKQINSLLMSDGDKFIEKAIAYGVDSSFWSWNSKAADLDNDQWQDIYIGNGFHFGDGFYEIHENIMFHNVEGKRFEQVQKEWGLDDRLNTHSYTYTDFDFDGDIDIVATSFMSGVTFYINQGSKNNSIRIKLIDSVANINGIGSQVSIFYGDNLKQIRELKLSGGYMSFDNPIAHFGLGNYQKVNKIIIRWSDGVTSVIENNLSANYVYNIRRKK